MPGIFLGVPELKKDRQMFYIQAFQCQIDIATTIQNP
jgi:hypothetical protein